MLVPSPRINDKVFFPNLGISIGVLCVVGNRVRLGIDAPHDVKVLRQELVENFEAVAVATKAVNARLSHDLRNRLNTATLALHLTQQQLQVGRVEEAETTLEKAFHELQALEGEMNAGQSPT